jgi:hypothetical protein
MKYLILFLLCVGSAHAEKERGGGSLDRLLLRAGASIAEQPKTNNKHDIKEAFYFLAGRFMTEIRARRASGQMAYTNFSGQSIQLNDTDFVKLESAIYALSKNALKIHERISSSRGDSIGFVNNSKDMTLIVSSTEFERILNIANPDLRISLGTALVGHELLSLVGIENSDQFGVSATLAEDAIWKNFYLRCGVDLFVTPFFLMVDKRERKIKHWNSPTFFPIDKIEIDLAEPQRRLQFSAISGGFKVRVTGLGDRYILEYEAGSKLVGTSENFFTWDSDRFLCTEIEERNLPPLP